MIFVIGYPARFPDPLWLTIRYDPAIRDLANSVSWTLIATALFLLPVSAGVLMWENGRIMKTHPDWALMVMVIFWRWSIYGFLWDLE